ncbi:unnamed protein product [Peronospora farinosa]|uniref:Thioredoxin domain-containing protein n=1 Tax=Peronospora farinosa TaxID=134698 RepID=A0AAV0UD94_9STRA|nr:unnamed protein product [Peronospora farinosa]
MRIVPIIRRLSIARAFRSHVVPRAAAPFVLNPVHFTRPSLQFTSIRSFATDDDNDLFLEDEEDDSFVQYPPLNGEITDVSLDMYRGQYVVLFFYPKDFTYVCPTEIIAFNDRAEEFKALNTQLIAASCDSPESHLAWTRLPRNKGGLGKMDIPIVSDITKALQFVEEHGEVCPANWQPGEKTINANPTGSHVYFSSVKEIGEDDDGEDDDVAVLTLVKTKAQFQELIKSGKPVVADFMAPWCGKCAQIEPTVVSLAEAYPEVTFAKMDVSIPEVEKLKDELKVGAYPEFRFFKDGKEVHEKISGYKKSLLKKAVQKLL